MKTVRVLLVVVVTTVALATLAVAQVADHLKCYKVKDPLLLSGTVDLDSPQFGAEPGCKIARATPPLFCVPATKTVVEVRDRRTGQPITPLPIAGPDPGDRLCYKIKCDAPAPPDTQVTDQFGTRTVSGFRAKLLCTPAVKGGPPGPTTTTTSSTTTTTLRFVDNGDGTVSDRQTGLQWEKKTGTVGAIVLCDTTTCSDPHDVNNAYRWSSSGSAPDGGAFTSFLATLNGGATGVGNCASSDGSSQTGGFVNHCDWRLPTVAELRTILLAQFPSCGTSPCIDATFGPTGDSHYWSSTTTALSVTAAFSVRFDNGNFTAVEKTTFFRVRAVRGGIVTGP
jgi:Protein of unknown function (DUF1566)